MEDFAFMHVPEINGLQLKSERKIFVLNTLT